MSDPLSAAEWMRMTKGFCGSPADFIGLQQIPLP